MRTGSCPSSSSRPARRSRALAAGRGYALAALAGSWPRPMARSWLGGMPSLLEDLMQVVTHGPVRDAELLADLPGRQARRGQLGDLQLLRGQPIPGARRPAGAGPPRTCAGPHGRPPVGRRDHLPRRPQDSDRIAGSACTDCHRRGGPSVHADATGQAGTVPSPGQGLSRCRSRGNSVTCRTLAAPVSRPVHRSRPIAKPPCGGTPCSNTCRYPAYGSGLSPRAARAAR
jgi:hypothetical protein